MKQQFIVFLIRWALNTIGLWVAVSLFGTQIEPSNTSSVIGTFLLAGLIFSMVNSIIKPIVVILSLPAIILTLGLFTLIVNGLMVYISLKFAPGLDMTFGGSILAGIVMSLVNYIVSSGVDQKENSRG